MSEVAGEGLDVGGRGLHFQLCPTGRRRGEVNEEVN